MDLNEIENLRIKARNCILKSVGVFSLGTLVLCIYFKSPTFLIFGIIFGIIITFFISSRPIRNFNQAFKNKYVLKALESIFTDLKYLPDLGIDSHIIRDTEMMNMGDRYSSNDYVEGKYKNISVMQADVHIEEKHETTDSNGHTHTSYVTIFRGRWMVFDFNKTFKANIQVSQKGFSNSKISNWGKKEKFKKVMMEDTDFNDKFKVYAQNEHEAFYILTPSLMEKIKVLTSKINGKLLFCFVDNKLHVGVLNHKDSFEHDIFKTIIEQDVINNINNDINVITNFVDELDLDINLFKRGGGK